MKRLYDTLGAHLSRALGISGAPAYPATKPKGAFERWLQERYGRKLREVYATDPLGASDVGDDQSSGGEFLEMHPSFPDRRPGEA